MTRTIEIKQAVNSIAAASLTLPQRLTIIALYHDQKSDRKTAMEHGVTPAAVRKRLTRAKQRLAAVGIDLPPLPEPLDH